MKNEHIDRINDANITISLFSLSLEGHYTIAPIVKFQINTRKGREKEIKPASSLLLSRNIRTTVDRTINHKI